MLGVGRRVGDVLSENIFMDWTVEYFGIVRFIITSISTLTFFFFANHVDTLILYSHFQYLHHHLGKKKHGDGISTCKGSYCGFSVHTCKWTDQNNKLI